MTREGIAKIKLANRKRSLQGSEKPGVTMMLRSPTGERRQFRFDLRNSA